VSATARNIKLSAQPSKGFTEPKLYVIVLRVLRVPTVHWLSCVIAMKTCEAFLQVIHFYGMTRPFAWI
jgi:hypothetical protein